MITGGLGGLGLRAATELMRNGASRMLKSRISMSDEYMNSIRWPRVLASCFFCAQVPDDGADTLFVNTADGFDRLGPQLQEEVQGKRGVHVLPDDDGDNEKDIMQFAVAHPLCRAHPETGRPCLYLSAENSAGVEGMP